MTSAEDTVTAYLAPEGFLEQVKRSVSTPIAVHDRLVLVPGPARDLPWAQNVWHDVQRATFSSISEAVKILRDIQRNWSLYQHTEHRRAALIQEQLPHVSAKPLTFPALPPAASLGSWTLADRNTILYSSRCSSPFPNGEVHFNEDRSGPPNRAYLKLWEALTRLAVQPQPGARCLDAGASPGGWSWVLSQLGLDVLAVDRAPLDEKVSRLKNIKFQTGDAFGMRPGSSQPFDWIFSDVVSYPEKLYEWVYGWIDSGKCENFVITVKFQGNLHYDFIERFSAFENSALVHLFHNKHELTWLRVRPGETLLRF